MILCDVWDCAGILVQAGSLRITLRGTKDVSLIHPAGVGYSAGWISDQINGVDPCKIK